MEIVGAGTSGAVTVGSSSTAIAAANQARRRLVITNISDEVVYLSEGAAAESGKGYPLAPGATTISEACRYRMPDGEVLFRGAVNGICASGGKSVAVLEA